MALNIVKNEPINHVEAKSILGGAKNATIRTYFYDKRSYICCLETIIAEKKSKTGEYVYSILSESLWEKPIATVKSKKYLTDFTGMKPVEQRNSDEAYLSDDVSFVNVADLEQYLSSGTIKGIITFSMVKEVLHSGGYLLVDEIENHFNKEIVTTLVRFFMDSRLNKNGGTPIFTTHYPELLDEYDRNDGICIVRNRNGITAEAYMRLKKSLAASIN